MPTTKNRFQILNLHPKIRRKKTTTFFNGHLSKFYLAHFLLVVEKLRGNSQRLDFHVTTDVVAYE